MIARVSQTPNRDRNERGAALILVLMLVAVFLILMGSLIDVLAIESQNTIESSDAESATTAAYAGVDLMVSAVEEFQNGLQNGQPPKSVDCSFSRPGGGTVTTGCTANIIKTWTADQLNYYLIQSTGFARPSDLPSHPQEVDRTVNALVKEIPFGAYAHFAETETSNTGNGVWYTSGQNFNGPVYSGGKMKIQYDSKSQTPIFPQGFTTDDPTIRWWNVEQGDGRQPRTPAEYASVYGSSAPNFVPSSIPLPGSAQNLAVFSEAYFGDSAHADQTDLQSAGATPGVFLNGGSNCPKGVLCTGIFIAGNATVHASSTVSPGGNILSGTQTWTIDVGGGHWVVTADFNSNTTTVEGPTGTQTYTGTPTGEQPGGSNGAIFDDGNLTITDGSTVHGQYTIAVPDPPINNESMTLTGSLTYAEDPLKGQASQDELALWADEVLLNSSNPSPEIEGMILTGFAGECTDPRCGGYFANANCKKKSCTDGTGYLTIFGSDIENMRGQMGFVDANGNPLGGYLRLSTYDSRLGVTPPPFSPTTNLYAIVALADQGVLP